IWINGDIYLGVWNGLGPGLVPRTLLIPAQPISVSCVQDERNCTTFRNQAVAVKYGRVLSTGTNDEIRKLAGPNTKVIDLAGHFVMPGFNDAHSHLASGGFEKLNVNLIGTKSLVEMQSRIAERVKTALPGEWIVGRGWDHTM